MKKTIFISTIVVVIIASVIFLTMMFYPSAKEEPTPLAVVDPAPIKKQSPVVPTISQAEVDATIKEQRAELAKQKAYVKKIEENKDFAESERQRLIAENPQAQKMYRLVQAATFPIEFHGKVTDEKSKPLADVEIKYSIGAAYGMGQPIHQLTKTDSNGRYRIKGEGALVSINRMTKTGYQFPKNRHHFFTVTESGRPNTWRDHTVNNPYITLGHNKVK